MSTSPNGALAKHGWLDVFLAEPLSELTRLLAGRAEVYPYTRAEPVDAARMLFGDLDPEDPARTTLSGAILDWLRKARSAPLSINPAVQQNQIRQVVNAFEIVGALDLLAAAEQLRREYIRWRTWVDTLVIGPSRDGRAAYLRMLAATQIPLAQRFANPDGLMPMWIRLCVEAGASLPDNYLQIGLVGLRKLPVALRRGDTPWLAGLSEWALAHDPSDADFMRVWRPLKRLYPSSHAVLRKQVYSLLSQATYRRANIVPPGWWGADPDFPKAQGRGTISFEPPPKEVRESILESIELERPFSLIKPRVDQLIESHRLYATRSGESDYLVRTFSNVGYKLIEHGRDARIERAQQAQMLARETLNHKPFDVIAWSLWRDSLVALGHYEAARDLAWEIVRRFPNNSLVRNLLAELLAAGGEMSKALRVVGQTVEEGIADAVTYLVMARIEAACTNFEEAKIAAKKGLELDPMNPALMAETERLNQRKLPGVDVWHYKIPDVKGELHADPGQDEVLRNGRLRALRDQLVSDEDARSELHRILNEDPTFAYAQILAARHRLWQAEDESLPPVAAAFEIALTEQDRGRLVELAKRAPRLIALIHLARALFGDEESAEYIARLLSEEDEGRLLEGEKIIKFRLAPVLQGVEEGEDPVKAIIAQRMRVLNTLYDANEALAAQEFLAA